MAGDGRGGNGSSIGASLKENDVVDGQISEDEKMEKFYALIKSYKEARERRRMELERLSTKEEGVGVNNDKQGRKRKRSTESGDRTTSNWIPAFKWEDFGENSQIKFRNCPVSLPGGDCIGRLDDPSPSQAEVEGGGLDLRLRL